MSEITRDSQVASKSSQAQTEVESEFTVSTESFTRKDEIEAILFMALAILLAFLLWAPYNLSGVVGTWFSQVNYALFGTLAPILPLIFVYLAAESYFARSPSTSSSRKMYIFIFLCFLLCFISLLTVDLDKVRTAIKFEGRASTAKGLELFWYSGESPQLVSQSHFWSGGFIGGISAISLIRVIGRSGGLIVVVAMLLALTVLTFNVSWKRTIQKTAEGVNETGKKLKAWGHNIWEKRQKMFQNNKDDYRDLPAREQMEGLAGEELTAADSAQQEPIEEEASSFSYHFPTGNWLKDDFGDMPFPSENSLPVIGPRRHRIRPLPASYKTGQTAAPRIRKARLKIKKAYLPAEPASPTGAGKAQVEHAELQEIASRLTWGDDDLGEDLGREDWDDRSASLPKVKAKPKQNLQQLTLLQEYLPPPANFLLADENTGKAEGEESIRLLGAKLEKTLQDFGVDAKVVNFITGPTISRFEVRPGPGVKVSRIVNLSDDIALALAAIAVRIEAPIPGKSAIGIEIPNKNTQAVRLRDLIESKEFRSAKSPLIAALGRNIQGEPILCDLSAMPHLLIAGATGSGKSVCINSILISLLYRSSPQDLRIVMIDPKVVELSVYNGIPHLASPVVTDPKKAYGVLEWAVTEMENRYKLFADNSVRDFKAYNTLVAQNQVEGGEHLPYILLVIDELSDLMATTPSEVEDAIARLTSMARAAGIHLIIATQRPSVDVITGVIKANIPSRISFAVASQVDSRTILDMGGAEKLLGKGDMLYYPQNAAKPLRGQGAFVTDAEVERVISYLKSNYSTTFDEDLKRQLELVGQTSMGSSGSGAGDEEEDELLYEALRTVVENEYASVSLLQRRLNVGYPRAARMVDTMHDRGWIGPFEGSKPRKLLITAEEAEEILELNT